MFRGGTRLPKFDGEKLRKFVRTIKGVKSVEWYWWAAIIVAIIVILPDPIGWAIGLALDRYFNEFEETEHDVAKSRRSAMRKNGDFRDFSDVDGMPEPDE